MPQVSKEELLKKIEDMPQIQKAKLCRIGAGVCFLFFFIVLILYSVSLTRTASSEKRQVVVTTDGFPDDFIALKLLFKRSDIKVVQIIVGVSGFSSSVSSQLENMRRFMSLMSSEGCSNCASVKITYGSTVPIGSSAGKRSRCVAKRAVPETWSNSVDDAFGARYVPAFVEVANASRRLGGAEPMSCPTAHYLALGPLTDVASCTKQGEGWNKVQSATVSGGAWTVQGNVQQFYAQNQLAERNVFFDPNAAEVVLEGAPTSRVTLTALDAALPVDRNVRARLGAGSCQSRSAAATSDQFIGCMLYGYTHRSGLLPPSTTIELHDIATAMLFVDFDLQQANLRPISGNVKVNVRTNDADGAGEAVGQTTKDFTDKNTPVQVVLGSEKNAAAVWDAYFRTIALKWPITQ